MSLRELIQNPATTVEAHAETVYPIVNIDPQDGGHRLDIERAGGLTVSIDGFDADGVLDPILLLANPHDGIAAASSAILSVNPFGEQRPLFEWPLTAALNYGVANGGTSIGQALKIALGAGRADSEMMKLISNLAGTSPMFRAIVGSASNFAEHPDALPDTPTGTTRGRSTIINGDSREVLKRLPDNSVDSIIVDPPYELGFTGSVGKTWDSTGIAFDVHLWTEALRVLKPGGNLAAFGASRTSHRLAVAIEDSGFEIRDTILVWMYGQGQAKGTDVSRELRKSKTANDAANGFHTNLKPAHEPIVLARKPFDSNLIHNWETWGVGGLNIDATRIATDESRSRTPGDAAAATWAIQRGDAKNESHALGRWTPNVVLCHTITCVEDGGCSADCAVEEVRLQGLATRGRGENVTRFFPTFRYQPKAIKSERPEVNGVQHPTVKPLALISWLIELLTPRGGVVLDFFAGSGTTGEAAEILGFPSILIERDGESIPLINQRFDRIGAV